MTQGQQTRGVGGGGGERGAIVQKECQSNEIQAFKKENVQKETKEH